MPVTFKGLPNNRAARAKLADLATKVPIAEKHAIKRFGQIEMAEMKRIVPRGETDHLYDSGFVDEPEVASDGAVQLRLGFDAEYAVYVHEDLEAFHSNGEAKFVESVLNQSKRNFNDRVVADMKKELGM
jgi:hypothetical protein